MNDTGFTYFLDEQRTTSTIIGCGGAGSKMITRMFEEGVDSAKLVSLNTDVLHFHEVKSDIELLIGHRQTHGLGAGADPEIARTATNENVDIIREVIDDSDMVFVTAGLGGGTGTGSAPVVAEIAQESGALTLAIVTMPFGVEGSNRRLIAEAGLKRLRQVTDTLLVLQNDRLLEIDPNLPLYEAFKVADKVVVQSVKGISELITASGLVNPDFTDVQSVIGRGDIGTIGLGESSSEDRAQAAMKDAVHSLWLDIDLQHTSTALINITGGPNMSLKEVEAVAESLYKQTDIKGRVVWGTSIDETYEKKMQILLIAAGLNSPTPFEQLEK